MRKFTSHISELASMGCFGMAIAGLIFEHRTFAISFIVAGCISLGISGLLEEK